MSLTLVSIDLNCLRDDDIKHSEGNSCVDPTIKSRLFDGKSSAFDTFRLPVYEKLQLP